MSRFDELSAFEVATAERTSGQAVNALQDDNAPKLGLMGALAWQHVRRSEPGLAYDDYMKRVRYDEPGDYLFGADEEPTPEAEAAGFPVTPAPDAGASSAEGERLPGAENLTV